MEPLLDSNYILRAVHTVGLRVSSASKRRTCHRCTNLISFKLRLHYRLAPVKQLTASSNDPWTFRSWIPATGAPRSALWSRWRHGWNLTCHSRTFPRRRRPGEVGLLSSNMTCRTMTCRTRISYVTPPASLAFFAFFSSFFDVLCFYTLALRLVSLPLGNCSYPILFTSWQEKLADL